MEDGDELAVEWRVNMEICPSLHPHHCWYHLGLGLPQTVLVELRRREIPSCSSGEKGSSRDLMFV